MADPCSEKDKLEKLFEFNIETKDKLHIVELRQVQIASDVTHVKGRIDNGMSHTIKETNDILKRLEPVIAHHDDIVKRIEDFGWLISRWLGTGLIISVLGMMVWAITKGWLPK